MHIAQILSDLTAERNNLDQAIDALERLSVPRRRGRPPKSQSSKPAPVKRTMSPVARKRLSEAMTLRWAKWKGKSAPIKAASPAKKATVRGPMSPAMKKKMSALMKKSWAEKKKAGASSL